MYPVTLDDLQVVRGVGPGDFYHVVCGVHRRPSDFIHAIVVHRRDEAINLRNSMMRLRSGCLCYLRFLCLV